MAVKTTADRMAKTTADRMESLAEIMGALDFDFEEVLADLEQILAASGAEQPASAEQLGALPRELLAHLQRLLEDLLDKDTKANADALTKREKGQVSRKAFKDTRKELMRTRDMLQHVYGNEQADKLLLGVPKQISRDIVAGLLRMCRNTLRQLNDPDVKVEVIPALKRNYPKGKAFFVPTLKEHVDNLRKVYREYLRAEVKLIGSQVARRAALKEYNTCFPDIAKVFECLYRLSGRMKRAQQFQASGQVKGLLRRMVKLRNAIKKGLKKAKKKRQEEASAKQAAAKG